MRPIYRDPVHDFGILQFDVTKIKHQKLKALDLRPEGAKVGVEVRVVGNDAGEKLSILSGVISRLDRNAPDYGEGYSDFNTNYIQAAAAATGGSSGSPVVNLAGHTIALQAGGRIGASTDYFLPLDRPARALECIQKGEPITRGTIQTQWSLKPFDECKRLGLTPEWETAVRNAAPEETTNILVGETVLPEGPAEGKIQEGDVLIKVNGEFLTNFVKLDEVLDSSVGKPVRLLLQRGGEDIDVTLDVGDLHAITPDRFVTMGGGSFHSVSYQQARHYAIAAKGVYVCEAAGSFKLHSSVHGWKVESVDNQLTPNLDTFIQVVKDIPDRKRVVITYRHLRDIHYKGTSIVYIDRHWHPKMRQAIRNDVTGLWDFTDIGHAKPEVPLKTRSAEFLQLDINLDGTSHPAAAEIVRSFVRVTCTMPAKLDGFPQSRKNGHGLVIDAEKGLVLVSRAVVPYDLCDLTITVADSIMIEGKVVFLHPLQNYTIIQYDPKLVDAPVKSAVLSDQLIKKGEDVLFVGFNHNKRILIGKTAVTDVSSVSIPSNAAAPRYRAVNLDAVTVDTSLSGQCTNGALIKTDGTVKAIWMNYLGDRDADSHIDVEYSLGLAVAPILPVVSMIQRGEKPVLRILGIEAQVMQMNEARIMGLSEEWISKVSQANPTRHQLFMVRKLDCPTTDVKPKEDEAFQEGDILVTLNDQLITQVSDFDIMYDQEALDALVVRKGEEKKLRVATIPTESMETSRALLFCGAVIQAPHHAVRQQTSKLHSEIYVAARTRGSPSAQYGLGATNFITAVNGVKTQNLDDFVEQVNKIPDNTYFRLRMVTFDNVPWVVTMKKNDHYVSIIYLTEDLITFFRLLIPCIVPHVRICQRPRQVEWMEGRHL